jgi:hypothetical protein
VPSLLNHISQAGQVFTTSDIVAIFSDCQYWCTAVTKSDFSWNPHEVRVYFSGAEIEVSKPNIYFKPKHLSTLMGKIFIICDLHRKQTHRRFGAKIVGKIKKCRLK